MAESDRSSPVRLKVHCSTCGEQVIRVSDVMLYLHSPRTEDSEYTFWCPVCKIETHREATPRVIEMLRSVGVAETLVAIPAEALEPRVGAPISWEDYRQFIRLLDGWDGVL